MTREETKQIIPIMQAFADGKKIESTIKGGDGWSVNKNPDWNWDRFDYRISPNQEPKEKHYRPYTMEEFVEEMHKHDGFVRMKNVNNTYGALIIGVGEKVIALFDVSFPYYILLNDYIWSDNGQPCGKEVEE